MEAQNLTILRSDRAFFHLRFEDLDVAGYPHFGSPGRRSESGSKSKQIEIIYMARSREGKPPGIQAGALFGVSMKISALKTVKYKALRDSETIID